MTPGQAAYEARLHAKGERLRYVPQPDYAAIGDDLRAEWEAAGRAAIGTVREAIQAEHDRDPQADDQYLAGLAFALERLADANGA